MHTEVAIHSMNAYVWCWRKACGSLDEIPSVTMGTCKRKFLMNSNMTLTVINLHQQTQRCNKILKVTTAMSKVKSRSHYDVAHLHPLTNVPTKYQLPTGFGFQDIAQTRFYRSMSLRQGQRTDQGHTMTLHTYTP